MAEMEMLSRAPSAPLAGAFDAYVGYLESGSSPGLHRGLPSATLTLIVTIDDPCHVVAQPGTSEAPGRFRTVVGGLHTTPALIAHQGFQQGVQLGLSPLASRALLGMPAGALPTGAVELDDVVGRAGSELWERVAEESTWEARFAVLDAELSARAVAGADGRHGRVAPELAWAWERLRRSGGTITVNELSRDIGWSRRHLAATFRREFGLTPKMTARVMRFSRARHLLPARRGDQATVAAECGYADQAHMIRDFHEFCGCAPGQWLAEEHDRIPSVSAITAEFA
jgi:AraC-like DNA-binding protein